MLLPLAPGLGAAIHCIVVEPLVRLMVLVIHEAYWKYSLMYIIIACSVLVLDYSIPPFIFFGQ